MERDPRSDRTKYWKVFLTFARNSLVRDMTFRTNFVLQCIGSIGWTLLYVGFYLIIFQYTTSIGADSGWDRDKFFLFIATTWFINSLVQAFFMPNAEEFSELIRTGGLDFALLKPIDTQFLISFRRVDWSALSNFAAGFIIALVAARLYAEMSTERALGTRTCRSALDRVGARHSRDRSALTSAASHERCTPSGMAHARATLAMTPHSASIQQDAHSSSGKT